MRKVTLVLLAMLAAGFVHAQQDTTLQQYTGKYKFPDGNPVTEMTVIIENGVLYANSAMGSSELKKKEEDVFEIVVYSGVATFKRNPETKVVNAVKIEAGDLVMEGTKSEGGSILLWLGYSGWQR
jgi:hypothetical protein